MTTSPDFRHALRALRRSPGFFLVAGTSLALAVALNTVMFAVVDAMLRPRYPVRAQEQVYTIRYYATPFRATTYARMVDAFTHAPFVDQSAAANWTGYMGQPIEAGGRSATVRVAMGVDSNYFSLLGAVPAAGRLFAPNDGDVDATHVAVVSYRVWRELQPNGVFSPFAATYGNNTYTVIGALPDRLERALDADLWVGKHARVTAGAGNADGIFRARAGVSRSDIDAALLRYNARIAGELHVSAADSRYEIHELGEPVQYLRDVHYALIAAAIAVLLIACANIANLEMARGVSRARELAVRSALGASRAQLARLLLAESAILALCGGAAGTLLSVWGIAGLRGALPPVVQGLGIIDPQMSWRVFAVAAGITAFATLAFGLWPALTVSRANIDELLKSGAGTSVTRRVRRRYNLLIIVETAGALALFAGAAQLFGAALRMHDLDFGYDTRNLVTTTPRFVELSGARSLTAASKAVSAPQAAFFAALRARPEVVSAAGMDRDWYDHSAVTVQREGLGEHEEAVRVNSFLVVTADYFRTLKQPILSGADFNSVDDGTRPLAIIDSAAAAQWWPHASPIGQMIKLGRLADDRAWIRVIGVVHHARLSPTNDDDGKPQVYVLARNPAAVTDSTNFGFMSYIVRVRSEPQRFASVLSQGGIGGRRVYRATLWSQAIGLDAAQASHDFVAEVFVAFAAFSLTLAGIGIFGVVAHSVSQRRREFGVRYALGADRGSVIAMVIREGNLVVLAGLAGGLLLVRWEMGAIDYFLHDVSAGGQTLALVVAPIVTFAVAIAATLIPAINAARVDPLEALRNN